MEMAFSVKGFLPGLAFRLGRFAFELDWPFAKVGKRSFWIERTGHKPANGWAEVSRQDAHNLQVFAFGRRLTVSREA